jgi:hypothetical protein
MRNVSNRIARTVAVLVLVAVTTQAAALPSRERLSFRQYVKRLVIKAFHSLGCPPGCEEPTPH